MQSARRRQSVKFSGCPLDKGLALLQNLDCLSLCLHVCNRVVQDQFSL